MAGALTEGPRPPEARGRTDAVGKPDLEVRGAAADDGRERSAPAAPLREGAAVGGGRRPLMADGRRVTVGVSVARNPRETGSEGRAPAVGLADPALDRLT